MRGMKKSGGFALLEVVISASLTFIIIFAVTTLIVSQNKEVSFLQKK